MRFASKNPKNYYLWLKYPECIEDEQTDVKGYVDKYLHIYMLYLIHKFLIRHSKLICDFHNDFFVQVKSTSGLYIINCCCFVILADYKIIRI